MSFKFEVIKTLKEWKRPDPIIFADIGCIMLGHFLWLWERDYDGKDMKTSTVTGIEQMTENIVRIHTKNGSIYQITKV